MHVTHYDQHWPKAKDQEPPFDLSVGLELIDAMADVGFNVLVVDCEDGLRYACHPELTRSYSVPMETLAQLAQRARRHDIDVVPKLNFARSALHRHNDWFRPHDALFDTETYWTYAFEVIDELIAVAQPPRWFHVGMDEDHDRSYGQYVEAIKTLHAGLRARSLRTIIWNDSAGTSPETAIHRDKSMMAEQAIPNDVVHVLWDYHDVKISVMRRIRDAGFDLWGAPDTDPAQFVRCRDALLDCGGTGILLTRWIPCVKANRQELLRHIRTLGPLL
jgi:hypothetical protein